MSSPSLPKQPEFGESWPLSASFLASNSKETMSGESISELPLHYGEVQKDGTMVERQSEELPRSAHGDIGLLLPRSTHSTPYVLQHHASVGPAARQEPMNGSVRDETQHEQRGFHRRGKSNSRRLLPDLEVGRPLFNRGEYRQSMRGRYSRPDGYERYDDYDDDYDEPYVPPQRVRDRAYFPEDEYGSLRRRQQQRASSRYASQRYPPRDRDGRRRSLEDYEETLPRTPHRFYSQKKARGPSTVREAEKEEFEDDESRRDTSPAINRQIRFKDLSPEERKQIMRLPWTQWMDSSTKNRKPWDRTACSKLTPHRLRCYAGRVHRHNHVPVVRLCRNPSREYSFRRLGGKFDLWRCYRLLGNCSPLHCCRLRLLADGQCLGLLSHLRRSLLILL